MLFETKQGDCLKIHPESSSVLLERKRRIVRSSLSHRSPLCFPGEGRWGVGWGNSAGWGDLAAWISSKKGWPDAQPGVLQGLVKAPFEVGTGMDKEQRLGKIEMSL